MKTLFRLPRPRQNTTSTFGFLHVVAPILIALAITLIFNWPALRAHSNFAGYVFTGDILGFYWPSLLKIRNLIAHGHFTAIDFSHFNGSADYFLSPNLYPVYPVFIIYSLASSFFKVSASDVMLLLVWTVTLNFFVATYFPIKLAVRFLKWDLWQASLMGAFFGCSIYFVSCLFEPEYLFCAATVPWIAYGVLRFIETPSKSSFIFATVPVVFGILGGYLPLGLAAVAFGVAIALLIRWLSGEACEWLRLVVLMALPIVAAVVVVSPFLAASYRFLKDSPSNEYPGLFYSAHQLADLPQAILRVLSFRYTVPGPFTEMSASIGLIGLMILALFFFRKDIYENFEPKEIHAVLICIGIYSFFVLITYGQMSPLSDAVFYFVPQIGKMHIYQRFLLMGQFFLAMALAIILNGLTRTRQTQNGRVALIITALLLVAVAFGVAHYPEAAAKGGLSGYTIFELLGLFVFLAFYRSGNRIAVFLSALVLMNVGALDVMYDWSLEANSLKNGAVRNPVALDEKLQSKIVQFMRSHCKKDVVKYVDMSPMWGTDGIAPFPKSFPYWVENQIALSSYHGFNFYLSTRGDYMSLMPVRGNNVLQPNWQWVEATGADFAVVDAGALERGVIPSDLLIADSASRLYLPNNLVIVPLKQTFAEPGNLAGPGKLFNNGVFRAYDTGAAGIGALLYPSANLALNKSTRESSRLSGGATVGGDRAVDGNTTGDLAGGSVFHSQPEKSPWFEVDLGAQETLGMVRIWNRTDCCQDRLNDSWLFLSDTPFPRDATAATLQQSPKIWRKHMVGIAATVTIPMDGAHGRYLRVQADAPDGAPRMLNFAELEAFRSRAEVRAISGSAPAIRRATGTGNFANEFSISLENERPVTVEYLMAYNPGLHFYVNGRETTPDYGPGKLARFSLQPGNNIVEVQYKNAMLSTFWLFYAVYGIIVAVAMIWTMVKWVRFQRPERSHVATA